MRIRNITMHEYLNGVWSHRTTITSRLDMSIFNFVVRATKYARACFQRSFREGGFYRSNKKWKARKKHYNHPMLVETGSLMRLSSSRRRRGRTMTGTIKTTERYGARSGKKERGYAAVHNDPLPSYTVNQYSTRAPVKRQFMGHNKDMYRSINKHLVPMIFKNVM